MTKVTMLAAVCALSFSAPAFAADELKCDDATMMKMQSDMDAATGDDMKMKKDMATKEMDMAKESMKANKMDDCMMHMKNAHDQMMKKS